MIKITFRLQFGAIGVLIAVSLLLNVVGLFTPCWVIFPLGQSTEFTLFKYRIVPYPSDSVPWFKAVSCLIDMSTGLFAPLICVYLHIDRKRSLGISCYYIRHWFTVLSILSLLLTLFQLIAFILMASEVPAYDTAYYIYAYLGVSSYMPLISAVLMGIALGLNEHLAFEYCVIR